MHSDRLSGEASQDPQAIEQLRVDLARHGIHLTVSGLLRAKDAARVLDRSAKTLTNWRYQGIGPPHVAIGGTIYYMVDDVFRYLAAGRGQPARPQLTRDRLAKSEGARDHDAMHVSKNSSLSTKLPAPVAKAVRDLARKEGISVAQLLSDALRDFGPVRKAMGEFNPMEDANERIRSAR